MKIDLSGKTAFVTGGNIGIGAAISKTLADAGAKVAFTYYSHEEEANATAAEIGNDAKAFQLDARESANVNACIAEVQDFLGGTIDILVNNAGHLVERVKLTDMTDDHWHNVMNVNISSAFYCTRAVLPYMPDGGSIVNMSSLAGRNGGGNGTAPYATSKAAVIGFTRAMAKELGERKINVNAIAPGFIIDTPFHETFTGKEKYEGIVKNIPMGRAGVPQDVANAVLYYVSDLGEWVSGQVGEINGAMWFV